MQPIRELASRWEPRFCPGDVAGLRARLIERIQGKVTADGAVRDHCVSRVLESALAVPLLRSAGQGQARYTSLERFLHHRGSGGAGFDRFLANASINGGQCDVAASFSEGLITKVPGFLADRKILQLQAFELLVGGTPTVPWQDSAFRLDGLHSWARVQVIAVKIITASALGCPDRITDEDVRVLLETQRSAEIWEGNILIHILVLHALLRLPRTAMVFRSGVRKLLSIQNDDGGFPFVTDTDTWSTATAAMALWSVAAPAELTALMADCLHRRQMPAGGWSYTDAASQTDADTTSVALHVLHCIGPEVFEDAIADGLNSIRNLTRADGGFPTYIGDAPSEACMTAACVDALSVQRPENENLIRRGLRFLVGQQVDDGSFPLAWSNSTLHTTYRVMLAAERNKSLRELGVDEMVRRCLAYVSATQNADGGWGQQPGEPSDIASTAYGLICACNRDDPRQAGRALAFLLAAYDSDEQKNSRPESFGPRPFVFDVPVLRDIPPLLALGHLTRRLKTAAVLVP